MKKMMYPVTYFVNIWTPTRVFKGRNQMNYFQIILTFLFLNALLLMPIAIKGTDIQAFQFRDMMPTLSKNMSPTVIQEVQQLSFQQRQLVETSPKVFLENNEVLIGQNIDQAQLEDIPNVLVFNHETFELKDESGYHFIVYYTDDFDLTDISSADKLLGKLEKQWYQQNRGYLTFTLLMMVLNVLLINNFSILFVSAILLWLAMK